MFERLMSDGRYAARTLRADVGFTLAAVITLAFGIGAVTALFTVLDGVLLKPLAYADPERTVALETRYPGSRPLRMTGGDFIDIVREREAFDKVAYYSGGEMGVQVAGASDSLQSGLRPLRQAKRGAGVRRRYVFLGVGSCIRDFSRCSARTRSRAARSSADDEQRSAAVGLAFAQRTFGTAEGALGKRVFVENRQYEIVGVIPDMMRFPTARRKSGSRTPRFRRTRIARATIIAPSPGWLPA